jgi:predicted RecB family nuclease
MSLLGTVITIAQLIDAELPELEELAGAVKNAIDQKSAAAATQAAIEGADDAVDADEQIILDQKKGLIP